MAKQSIMSLIKENVIADMISKDRAGNIIFRRSYFYRTGSLDVFVNRIQSELNALGLVAKLVDSGDHWAKFKGGKGVKANCHYYAVFDVSKL
jgi:hypothetical protein